MDPLPYEPRTFRDLIEADLRRAARLIIKHQSEIDWQFRIAAPDGDLHLAITMPCGRERDVMLKRVAAFITWKQAQAFILAVESGLPSAVYAVGISRNERANCFVHFNHAPKPWTARNFDRVKWLPEKRIEKIFLDLLPTSPQPMTPAEISGLQEWFGREGRFPAVHIESREIRGV